MPTINFSLGNPITSIIPQSQNLFEVFVLQEFDTSNPQELKFKCLIDVQAGYKLSNNSLSIDGQRNTVHRMPNGQIVAHNDVDGIVVVAIDLIVTPKSDSSVTTRNNYLVDVTISGITGKVHFVTFADEDKDKKKAVAVHPNIEPLEK